MSLTIFTSPRFADHLNPPGHPECVERFDVMRIVADEFAEQGGVVRADMPPASAEQITRVHTPEHVARIAATAGRATSLDPDTFTSPESYEVACLAAGTAIAAVDHVLDAKGSAARAFALMRPPGHHAEADRAMGFCLFNNIAVAAAHARARGLGRVAIVDYDVHHGNGTQSIFEADPAVLFVSSHQFPFYPGTGAPDETGRGEGAGRTVNIPLAAGATDADYAHVYARVVLPVLRQFQPDLILVSAGFDPWWDDPIGGMRVTTGGFARLAAALAAVADECCGGRLVALTEGGYNLLGLADCVRATIGALGEAAPALVMPGASGGLDVSGEIPPRAQGALDAVLPRIARWWTV